MSSTQQTIDQEITAKKIRFKDIKKPETVVCLFAANAGGTKLFHSYLDEHPEVYQIPCYPLIYLYPFWDTWKEEYAESWNWETLINLLCMYHASLLDSRKILGMNGLDTLGDNKDEHIEIDEQLFRKYLTDLLEEEPIERKTFLYAVHYAYSMARGEDMETKKVLFWHHHDHLMMEEFTRDVPEAIVIGTIRDPRPRVYRCLDSVVRQDIIKLNPTDKMYRKPKILNDAFEIDLLLRYMGMQEKYEKNRLPMNKIWFSRHEDMAYDLEGLMRCLCELLNITYQDSMLKTTFDGKWWYGHKFKDNMPQITGTYMRVLSEEWKEVNPKREIFIIEGTMFSFLMKYGYDPLVYQKDSFWNRVKFIAGSLLPFNYEWEVLFSFLNPLSHVNYIKYAIQESRSKSERKDYSTSGTFRYKWIFLYMKLWKKRWYERILDNAEKNIEQDGKSIGKRFAFNASRVLYVVMKYLKYLWLTIHIPYQYFRRVFFCYKCFYWRLTGRLHLAPQLGEGKLKGAKE